MQYCYEMGEFRNKYGNYYGDVVLLGRDNLGLEVPTMTLNQLRYFCTASRCHRRLPRHETDHSNSKINNIRDWISPVP